MSWEGNKERLSSDRTYEDFFFLNFDEVLVLASK